MTPEEAAEQMALFGHDFFVFVNAEDGETSVLYKRSDGQLGLIEAGAAERAS
jgi:putative sigma-54 modulation protein